MPDNENMVRRQAMLAQFGDFALGSDDLDEVLTEACRLVGGALGTHLSKIIEIEAEELFVRAGVGWPEGVVGVVRLPKGERSSETYSVKRGVPVIVPDIHLEQRFDFPEFMQDAGVVGFVNVPIYLPGRKPYGLLQVDSREEWLPDDQTTEFLRTYAAILGPVIDRLHKVHALRQATDRNEMLLRELQHRIKNNIGTIQSLVRTRARETPSEEARGELKIVSDRIEVLRLVHEQVYATGADDHVLLEPYVTRLLKGLLDLHRERQVHLHIDADEVEITSDVAVSLGLILNEFTTNSLKYAFDQTDAPMITLVAKRAAGGLAVNISDNGRGLPAAPISDSDRTGTGMQLIEGLSRQIQARAVWSSHDGVALDLVLTSEDRSL